MELDLISLESHINRPLLSYSFHLRFELLNEEVSKR